MWNWLSCYLTGRHDFAVTCESDAVYLRCNHCGKRSNGWDVRVNKQVLVALAAQPKRPQPQRRRA
jgi:hypothetical protein